MDSRHRLVFLKVIYEEAQHADHNNNHSRRPSDLAGIFDKIHKVPPNLGDFVLSCLRDLNREFNRELSRDLIVDLVNHCVFFSSF